MKTEFNTTELQEKFNVIGFGYGYCAVQDKVTNEKGSFDFKNTDDGRIYFNYVKH